MNLKFKFFISLITIIILAWANVFFFGSHNNINLSNFSRQAIHFAILAATFLIGYFNWKDHQQKWLLKLWIIVYGIIIIGLAIISIIFIFAPNFINPYWSNAIISLRNIFTGPLPLLVFYIFSSPLKKG